MEFQVDLEKIFKTDENNIVVIDTGNGYNCIKDGFVSDQNKKILKKIINYLGKASSEAQKLGKIITSFYGISGTRIYMKIKKNKAIGFIKMGEKHLFYRNYSGTIYEIDPLTVLDFYVHESEQRKGYGISIYKSMLEYEKIKVHKIGIDSPSNKFVNFMNKHFGLKEYSKQSSNFVIFDAYFDKEFEEKIGVNKSFKNYGFANLGAQNRSKLKNYYR